MKSNTEPRTKSIYRVDKFNVPATARKEFMDAVARTHELLGQQPGLMQNIVLEQTSGTGEFNIVTFVEWDSQESFDQAKAEMAKKFARMSFNPQNEISRLGVKADLANYRCVNG